MGTSTSLAAAGAKLDKVLSPATLRKMTLAGGMAAKRLRSRPLPETWVGIARCQGSDGVELTAGFDAVGASTVKVNYRPPGKWILAEKGRKGSKRVTAGSGRRAGAGRVRAFRTPAGPRRAFTSGPSRGLGTLSEAHRGAAREVPKAAHKAMRSTLGGVF